MNLQKMDRLLTGVYPTNSDGEHINALERFTLIRQALKSVGTIDDSAEKYALRDKAVLALCELMGAIELCSDYFETMDELQVKDEYRLAHRAVIGVMRPLKDSETIPSDAPSNEAEKSPPELPPFTDTDRLDFLGMNAVVLSFSYGEWLLDLSEHDNYSSALRASIDELMRRSYR